MLLLPWKSVHNPEVTCPNPAVHTQLFLCTRRSLTHVWRDLCAHPRHQDTANPQRVFTVPFTRSDHCWKHSGTQSRLCRLQWTEAAEFRWTTSRLWRRTEEGSEKQTLGWGCVVMLFFVCLGFLLLFGCLVCFVWGLLFWLFQQRATSNALVRTAKKSLLLSLLRQSYINFSCSSLRKYRKYCRTMCLVHEQSLDKKGTSKSRSNSLPPIWRRTKDQARIFCKRCHCGIRNQQHAQVAPLPWWQPLDSAGKGRWPLSQEREWWTGAEAGGVSVDPLFHSNWNQSSCSPEELWRTDLKKSLAKEVSHLLLSVQRPAVPKPCSPVVHSKCRAHPLVFKQDIPPLNYI